MNGYLSYVCCVIFFINFDSLCDFHRGASRRQVSINFTSSISGPGFPGNLRKNQQHSGDKDPRAAVSIYDSDEVVTVTGDARGRRRVKGIGLEAPHEWMSGTRINGLTSSTTATAGSFLFVVHK